MSISRKKCFTINVEGNIGSGKSELLKYFKKHEKIHVLEEDLNIWMNFHGYNLLDLKFKNPDFFQFPFQSLATLTRLKQHLKEIDNPIKMMERSLYSARKCFVETLKDMGQIHEGCYYVLEEYYDYIDEYHKIDCDLIIYIQTNPEICFERINSRSRKGEDKITLDYLSALHRRHEELYVEKASKLSAKVVVIDGNMCMEEMINEYKKCEEEIFQRI